MITQAEAERIAERVVGQPSDNPSMGWDLEEFEAGWLIRTSMLNDPSKRGAALKVIERETGIVKRFPSAVPTGRILHDYDRVRERGSSVEVP